MCFTLSFALVTRLYINLYKESHFQQCHAHFAVMAVDIPWSDEISAR